MKWKKEELMDLCRDENDIPDCGLCQYEFTDTCSLRLEKIKNEFKKIINERYGIKNEWNERNESNGSDRKRY